MVADSDPRNPSGMRELTPKEAERARARGNRIKECAEEHGYVGWDAAAIAAAYAFPLTNMQRVEGVTERYTAIGFRDPAENKIFVLGTLN